MDAHLKPNLELGREMYAWAEEMFPVCRSITGDGVRQTLAFMANHVPGLQLHEVPSGTQAFDWTVPPEWNIYGAYIEDPDGKRVVDFENSNLHVVGYSIPVDTVLPLSELENHLHSLPDKPDAIPYVTSYYEETWGFCLAHSQRQKLKDGDYRVYIDSRLEPGHLSYADLIIPGREQTEIFLSTYICHPSLANNELSGPVVTAALARWLSELPDRRYTYRIYFGPETIGALVYLSRNLAEMKERIFAGFNVSCVGDDRCHTYLASRDGNTPADRVARHVLRHMDKDFVSYSYLARGSDERQYCAPGIDLPVASVMRTRYGDYPEYHTSLDDLSVISPEGLAGGFTALQMCLQALEANDTYVTQTLGEPQLGRRNLISNLGYGPSQIALTRKMYSHLSAFADGNRDLLDLADLLEVPVLELAGAAQTLCEHGLLVRKT
jgi:aminopeptidase-like protein